MRPVCEMCKVNEFSSFEILDFNQIGPIEFLKKQIIWIILNGKIWHLWDQILKLCAGFFLRFQVSKVSLAKHLSNGTRYGQKSSADLGIINNFWQKYFTESTLKADNSPSPSFPRCFSWLLHWTRLRRLAWAKKYQRNFGVD